MNIKNLLEWEAFFPDLAFDCKKETKDSITHYQKIKIERDEMYRLILSISSDSIVPEYFQLIGSDGEFDLEGSCLSSLVKWSSKGCLVKETEFSSRNVPFRFDVTCNEIEIRWQNAKENDESRIVYWYLNGPGWNENFYFFRKTQRVLTTEYKLERRISEPISIRVLEQGNTAVAFDFFFVDIGKTKFIVALVPKEFGPNWSRNLAIEYRKEWGLPEEETEEAISEIAGFILGKHLLKVGYTTYDFNSRPIKAVGLNPWGENIVAKCRKQPVPPIPVPTNPLQFEQTFSVLTLQYLNLRDKLGLNDFLVRLFYSLEVPLELQIPIMQSALEMLAKRYLDLQNKNDLKTYVPNDEWKELIKPELKALKQKLKDYDFKERIISKIQNANSIGMSEKIELFLERIGLRIGNTEKEAIRERNALIHGGTPKTPNEYERLLRLSMAYRTLLHRSFLKLLNYSGDYIDYSSANQLHRNINVPLGG